MPTKLHAGTTLAALTRVSNAFEDSTSGRFDSAYVASGIAVWGGSSTRAGGQIETPTFAQQTTYWLRADYYRSGTFGGTGEKPVIELYNNSGTVVFRFIRATNTTLTPQFWNGATYTSGSAFTAPAVTTLTKLALNVVCGASGSWNLQADTGSGFSSISSGSITSASCDNVVKARLGGSQTATNFTVWSQIMGADYDISADHYQQAAITGNSAANTGAASGAYTDVNDNDDTTLIKVATSANKAGLTHGALTIPGGYAIGAMVIGARGRATGTITDGKLGIRSGGSNTSSSARSYGTGFRAANHLIDNDPATAAAFSQAGFNAAEIYLEAA